MQENKKLTINDFDLLKTIGQGSFGKVLQVGIRCFLLMVGSNEGDGKSLCYENFEQV